MFCITFDLRNPSPRYIIFDYFALLQSLQNGHFFYFLKWCHFSNTEYISKPFSHKTSLICIQSDFLWFLIFEVQPQSSSLLTILPDNTHNKMAIFATFQNDGGEWDFSHTQTRGIWGNFLATFSKGHFPEDISKKEKIQNTKSS